MTERQLSACSHRWLNKACKQCGLYKYQNDTALKTVWFESFSNCSTSKYLKHMRKRKCVTTEVKEISQSTALLMDAICQKFQYGIETRALAMYIYAKTCQKQESNEKFWTSASLMVASKGIELDKRVPYLNRYQRYADKSFSQEDYELAEKIIFQEMKFDIQYTTFMSFINFYLTTGAVFESDSLSDVQVRAFEDELLLKSKIMIRHGAFLQYQPEKLATSMINQARLKFQLEGWNRNLVSLTGINSVENIPTEKSNALKPLNVLQMKNRQKTTSVSHNSYNTYNPNKAVLSSIQNTLNSNAEAKLAKICRKKLQNTMKAQYNPVKQNCIKQNSMKIMQPVASTMRSQNYSLSKMSLTCSTDRIIPFNMFVSRR